ncbi:MAG: exodeoxyribonuclease VII large subunit [Firmicutes bacterium]|nr:exodeoxyribonuclease VII large subunit [Bacillota bacterium]
MEDVKLPVIGVAQLNNYLREYLAEDTLLQDILVQGEIAGFKAHSSGHIYFTLQEEEAGIKAVMFRSYRAELDFMPQDGMSVTAWGQVSLYEKNGSCQLYVKRLFPAGRGALDVAKDALKERLAAEGLFDPERKKPLPAYAADIGVITSSEGAAWADIRKVAYARFKGVRLTLYPTSVQGGKAPEEIAAAIHRADAAGHEILLCGRGGGSAEDLSAFDSEAVVRAIAQAQTPLISAVGHEVDFTLADAAADVRAATPSQGAELAVFSAETLRRELAAGEQRLRRLFADGINRRKQQLTVLSAAAVWDKPARYLSEAVKDVDMREAALRRSARDYMTRCRQQAAAQAGALERLSPLATLARGYALAQDENRALIRDAAQVQPGQRLHLLLAKGRLQCLVEQKEEEHGQGGEERKDL